MCWWYSIVWLYHRISFLPHWGLFSTLCKKGIVLNSEKFEFCRDTITFTGLTITLTGITPSPKLFDAIKNFPTPTDITGTCSWFGLANQVSWAYSISPIMQPFRDIVEPNTKFHWDSIEQLFWNSKELILSAINESIQSLNPTRPTCLQTDWSKAGIGYLLLQKYCQCETSTTPMLLPWQMETSICRLSIYLRNRKPIFPYSRGSMKIENPRLEKLKGCTLCYQFNINYCPEKMVTGPRCCILLSFYCCSPFIQ